MKVLQINTVFPQGSTGKICKGIAKVCSTERIQSYVAYAHANKGCDKGTTEIEISSWLDHHIHNRLARIFMSIGTFSILRTTLFLRKVKKFKPNIIHLHNLHGNFINLKLLFNFIKKEQIQVVWTLHDCWAFTGYCTYYTAVNCEKWKSLCYDCPNRHLDSVTLFDRSKGMYKKKQKMFSGVTKMELVTPSDWLKHEVEDSFLKNYSTRVINNGIDLTVFTPVKSKFRDKYQIRNDQFLLLGVANVWDERKGLDTFIELSKRLDDSFKIVLVGTTNEIDKSLPKTIISIHRTQNQQELSEIYSSVDLFVNPTIEDNFPTVNIESLACGTPVLTYDTGGSSEIIDEHCGCAVACGDIDALEREIIRICNDSPYSKEACLNRASRYDMRIKFKEYVDLYRELLNESFTANRV